MMNMDAVELVSVQSHPASLVLDRPAWVYVLFRVRGGTSVLDLSVVDSTVADVVRAFTGGGS